MVNGIETTLRAAKVGQFGWADHVAQDRRLEENCRRAQSSIRRWSWHHDPAAPLRLARATWLSAAMRWKVWAPGSPVPGHSIFTVKDSSRPARRIACGARVAFVTLVAAVALVSPPNGETQQTGKVYRIGSLASGAAAVPRFNQAFVDALREEGFVEGQNLTIERRFAAGRLERYPELVADLLRLNVDVIVAGDTPATFAAKAATTTIPIVMIGARDPVGDGLVASLAHPGGNITGIAATPGHEMGGKLLQLMKEAVPTASRVAILTWSSSTWSARTSVVNATEAAAQKLGLTLRNFDAKSADDFGRLSSAMVRERVTALVVPGDPFLQPHRKQIVELAERHRLPAIYGQASFVYDAGGMMFYGHDIVALVRQGGIYAAKILKGAKPADLPVEQPTRFELVINLKSAKALGLTIPPSVLLRADQIIE
jgi:putative ABC transport system substrate-binding protein